METGVLNSPVTTGTDNRKIEYRTAKDHATLSKQDFMNLFVMQLRYQDPMSPMDTAQMSSQMAELNMVDLMYKNNDAMNALVDSDRNRTNMSAVSMMGHTVNYQGSSLPVNNDGPSAFDFELAQPAASCAVAIRDGNGQVVKTWETGEISGARQKLGWDGTDMNGNKVDPGEYHVEIEALDRAGENIDVKTWTTGMVAGVAYRDKGMPVLRLENGAEIGMDKVSMVNT